MKQIFRVHGEVENMRQWLEESKKYNLRVEVFDG
jgi:hypothetical protein